MTVKLSDKTAGTMDKNIFPLSSGASSIDSTTGLNHFSLKHRKYCTRNAYT